MKLTSLNKLRAPGGMAVALAFVAAGCGSSQHVPAAPPTSQPSATATTQMTTAKTTPPSKPKAKPRHRHAPVHHAPAPKPTTHAMTTTTHASPPPKTTTHSTTTSTPKRTTTHQTTTTHTTTTTKKSPTSCIPQGANAGDMDADNKGGPTDGDGCI